MADFVIVCVLLISPMLVSSLVLLRLHGPLHCNSARIFLLDAAGFSKSSQCCPRLILSQPCCLCVFHCRCVLCCLFHCQSHCKLRAAISLNVYCCRVLCWLCLFHCKLRAAISLIVCRRNPSESSPPLPFIIPSLLFNSIQRAFTATPT